MRRAAAFVGLVLASLAAGAAEPATKSAVQLRVYEGFDARGPVQGRRDAPYALDVTAALTRCPNGNVAVEGMTIGGWRYAAGDPCGPRVPLRPDESASPVPGAKVIGRTQSAVPGTTIRCSPNTWRCGTTP
jgi:hypothetical protein